MLVDQASEEGSCTEQRKCVSGNLGGACAFRDVGTAQIRSATSVGSQAIDGAGLAPEEEPRPFRNVPFSPGTDFGYRAFELHQPVSVRIRERIQYDAFESGIDGRAGADAERERQNGDECKAGTLRERTHRVAQVLHERVDHSYLNATIGSIFVARQAGTRQARADPSVSSPMTPAYVAGSRRETPNNRATTARLAMNAVASPTTSPRTAKVIPCRTTRLRISPRDAPSADRTPISRTRSLTRPESRPYRPVVASTSATRPNASKMVSAKRRSASDAATSASIAATRTIGWSRSTDQIACLMAGARAAGSPRVRTTSHMGLSTHNHWVVAT